jgi:pectin methylesterase-like acyl-CoA thioesterase
MRKLFLFLSLLVSTFTWADEKEVTPATLSEALEAAADGDVLLLTSGKYSTKIAFPVGKTVTLKAAAAAEVELTGGVTSSDESLTGGGLIIDGVSIDPSNNYFVDLKYGDIKELTVKNSEIKNVYRCFLRTNNSGNTIDAINFDNCLIHDCGLNGWNFLYPSHTVKSVKVENTTLYNYTNGEGFFTPKTAYSGDFSFTFNHNTVYNWSKASKYAICNVDAKNTGDATYTFTNNIFYKGGTDGDRPWVLKATGGKLTASKNLIIEYGGYSHKSAVEQTIDDVTLEQLGLTALNFPDPDNGSFYITSVNPLATAATDGGVIGDTRWLKTITDIVHLDVANSPAEAGSVSPSAADYERGETVTLTATANYGYRFKEWQDAEGKTLSTENPYAYKVDASTTVTAVYETLTTYTFNVEKDGDGAKWGEVSLSPEPVDGKYVDGTIVTVSIVPNKVTSFLYWEDQTSDSKRNITVDADKTIKATFDVIPFITGWNFNVAEPRNDRPGDFYAETDNTGVISLYNGDGSQSGWGASVRNFDGGNYSCIRRYTGYADMSNPRSFVAKFSVGAYKNITVHFLAAADNDCVHKTQKLQYSLDGKTYIDLASFDITEKSKWMEQNVALPADIPANTSVYVRWIGDTASEFIGTPADNATEGFYLAEVIIYGEEDSTTDTQAPKLLSSSPAQGSNVASASGNIVLTYDKKIKQGTGNATLNGKELTGVYGTRTVSFAYAGMNYGEECVFTMPAGAVVDKVGNVSDEVTIKFNIMDRPRPSAKTFDAVVAADGTGDYTTVQAAIDAAPQNLGYPYLIFVKNGTYDELVTVSSSQTNIHLIGQDKEKTIITHYIMCDTPDKPGSNSNPNDPNYGRHAVVEIGGEDFYTENISYENSYGVSTQNGPMALAMRTNGDRFAFYNCKFRSFQDTWETSTHLEDDRTYVKDCHIEGAVDYFYGGGNAFLEGCTMYNVRKGSVIVAPCHRNATYGYVFSNCIIDGNELAHSGNTNLGRPWHNNPKTVYINTTAKVNISPTGWNNMGAIPALFAEYNTMDADGNPVDLSNRRTEYTYTDGTDSLGNPIKVTGSCKAVLTADEVSKYTYENVMSGDDHWNPRQLMEPVDAPTNINWYKDANYMDWTPSQYAICYIVYDADDNVLGFTKTPSLKVESGKAPAYIKAVNENGSLSQRYSVTISTGISQLSTNAEAVRSDMFTAEGCRTTRDHKGLTIVKTYYNDGSVKAQKVVVK